MAAEVIDTNVLVLATAAVQGWTRPRVPTDDIVALHRVYVWLTEFRDDASRHLVMDFPEKTIILEYRNNLREYQSFGRRVVQHKFDTNAVEIVELSYWNNGDEQVADLPDPQADRYFHDLGDRKIVAAAFSANAPIVNATDGDWTEPMVVTGLTYLGIPIVQLLTAAQRLACRTRSP